MSPGRCGPFASSCSSVAEAAATWLVLARWISTTGMSLLCWNPSCDSFWVHSAARLGGGEGGALLLLLLLLSGDAAAVLPLLSFCAVIEAMQNTRKTKVASKEREQDRRAGAIASSVAGATVGAAVLVNAFDECKRF